jgi:hypothetical protein
MAERPQSRTQKLRWITSTHGENLRKYGSIPRPRHPDMHLPPITPRQQTEHQEEPIALVYLKQVLMKKQSAE